MQEQVGIQRNETNSITFPGNAQVTRRAAGQVSSLIMRILKELRKKRKKAEKASSIDGSMCSDYIQSEKNNTLGLEMLMIQGTWWKRSCFL